MVQYKLLNLAHECYNDDQMHKLRLLYKGGFEIQRHNKLFLNKLLAESEPGYNERLKSAAYIPYLSQFIDFFSSFLFTTELHVQEAADKDDPDTLGDALEDSDFYKEFSANCDNNNNSMHSFIQEAFLEALIVGKAFVGIDFPQSDIEPNTLAEQEQLGLDRAYLYSICPETVIDWKYREEHDHKFKWLKIKNEIIVQEDPLDEPMKRIQFICWRMVNGFAQVETYESELLKLDAVISMNAELPSKSKITTKFTEIPVFELCIDEGLSIGEKIGPLCVEHYQARSLKNVSANKSLIAIPVVFLGPEIPEVGGSINETQSDPGRGEVVRRAFEGKGVSVLGSGDDFKVVESTGTAAEAMEKGLEKLEHTMLQVLHQMANSARANKGQGRSAEALQESRFQTEVILSSYAKMVKDFVKEVYVCISNSRGEEVVWVVGGLLTHTAPDVEELVKKALLLNQLNIPSSTFNKKFNINLASALLEGDIGVEERQQIANEISEAIESGEHVSVMEKQLMDDDEEDGSNQTQATPNSNSNNKNPVQPKQQNAMSLGSDDPPEMDESGHMKAADDIHLRGSVSAGIAETVYNILKEDYNEKDIAWVKIAHWEGPVVVSLNQIDFSNKDNWEAAEDPDHVKDFAKQIKEEGQIQKPIILVNEPNDNKLIVADGHHRSLAALEAGVDPVAYVAHVGGIGGDWKKMHDQQKSTNGGVASNQISSRQK